MLSDLWVYVEYFRDFSKEEETERVAWRKTEMERQKDRQRETKRERERCIGMQTTCFEDDVSSPYMLSPS